MKQFIDPERAQFDAFKMLDRSTCIHMLNLVKFRKQAAYPDGHELAGCTLSGADAYAHYGRDSAPILSRVGGCIVWRGAFEAVLIGPSEEVWDACFIAEYPNASAFLAMITDAEYKKAVIHRQAAVETSRLIRTSPQQRGESFA
jgi:uncharacterized protein (DUF1330 family)